MKRERLIELMEAALVSHRQWAEHFEKHPEVERQYVASGEWDNKETHREYEEAYREVLAILTPNQP